MPMGVKLLILAASLVFIYWVMQEDKKAKKREKDRNRRPPSAEAADFGCHTEFVYCGYQDLLYDEVSDERIIVNKREVFCHYCKQKVKVGSKCPFAQDHPDKLGPAFWG